MNKAMVSGGGWIDLHSHLLPGIDDGCQSWADSRNCVEQLLAHGFTGTVCTPHVWSTAYPHNTWDAIRAGVDALQAQLRAAGLDYPLWPGGEVRIDATARAWLQRTGVPTLGDSRYVLVDYWGWSWPPEGDELLEDLLAQGYQPLLAHPERMGFDVESLDELMNRLAERGVLFQGNLRSIAGGEGRMARSQARRLLDLDRYFAVALDMHGPESLPSRFEGMSILHREDGPARLATLLCERPRQILQLAAFTPG